MWEKFWIHKERERKKINCIRLIFQVFETIFSNLSEHFEIFASRIILKIKDRKNYIIDPKEKPIIL